MADRTQSNAQRNAGFTLAEMLVALSILSIGVTTLLAALSDSMSLRRSSDARLVAQEAVEDFVLRISQSGLRAAADATTPFDLELASGEPIALDGAPGMKIAAKTETDPQRPDVLLVRVEVSWLEGGDTVSEEFLRVIPRQLPLGSRIRAFRKEHDRSR